MDERSSAVVFIGARDQSRRFIVRSAQQLFARVGERERVYLYAGLFHRSEID